MPKHLSLEKFLENSLTYVLDTLFPIYCQNCKKEGSFICKECFQKIQLLSFQVCPRCERLITEKGRLCRDCERKKFPLNNLVAATRYKKNKISELIHLYKYKFVEDLHLPFAQLLIKIILKNDLPLPDLIVPVPLHPRRLRWRGFNQSELLADHIAKNLTPGFTIPMATNLLKRRKYTPPQMKIGKYSERRKNLQDAFVISSNSNIAGKKILLVDDIATTGTTLAECAKVLKQNGAKKVMGAVIARQEFGNS